MIWLLYNSLLTLLLPFWLPWVWLKSRKRKEQPNWSERMGNFDLPPKGKNRRVWIHAVSVGEFVAAKPILKELRKALPKHEIVVTVTTSSGHQTARDSEQGLYDHLFYFPLDVARFQLAAMQRVQPDVVAVMETELWLNLLWAADVFDARTLLINGRISDRSFPKSKRLRFFYRYLLSLVNRSLMQSETDAERISYLGAQDVEVLGNCKFDQATEGTDADPVRWRSELGLDSGKPTLVIGSTRGEEEEAFVIEALNTVGLDRVNVVHAPRHLERAEELGKAVEHSFGEVAFRSRGEAGRYLILDTYGELSSVYSVADLVVIGGGFANLGGQNILQPLGHGKPVIHGRHMQNFRDVADAAHRAGATLIADDPAELAAEITRLLNDDQERVRMGQAASELIKQNLGASRRYAEAIALEAEKGHARQEQRKQRKRSA